MGGILKSVLLPLDILTGAFLEGILLGLAISISIGPVFFSLVETSISVGARMAVSMAVGIFISDVFLITLGYLFSSLAGSVIGHSDWLKFAAAAFFIILGLRKMFFQKKDIHIKTINNRTLGFIQYFLKGFVVNAIHPALLVFWTAMVGIYKAKYPDNAVAFFMGALAITLSMDVAKSLTAWKLKSVVTPANIRKVVFISGGIFVGFGLLFLLEVFGFSFGDFLDK